VVDGLANVRRGLAGAALSQRVAQVAEDRPHQRDRQWDRLAGECRHAARELGCQIFRRQREAGNPAVFDRSAELADERQQPPLELDGRGEIGARLENAAPPALGSFEHDRVFFRENRHIRHRVAIMLS
jgi:hypothetical protein